MRAHAAAVPGGRPRGGAPAGQPRAAGAQPLPQRPPGIRPLALPGNTILHYHLVAPAASCKVLNNFQVVATFYKCVLVAADSYYKVLNNSSQIRGKQFSSASSSHFLQLFWAISKHNMSTCFKPVKRHENQHGFVCLGADSCKIVKSF